MSQLGISVDIEKSEITSDLNSTILFAFLMGMYTIIYFGTMYLYISKYSTTRRLVPITITAIFAISIIQTGILWYVTKWQFINNGDTRDSVFLSLLSYPQWIDLAIVILGSIGIVLADGLLIWRCYIVWNRSVRVISVSLLLIITEAGLFFAQIVLHTRYNQLVQSPALAVKLNKMVSSSYFISFGTSLITTILITYRIHSVLQQGGTSPRKFKHIMDIVVQSGALYSLSLFVFAMSWAVPSANDTLNTRIAALQDYAVCLNIAVAGISTTILVARVAMLAPDTTFPSTSIHLSGLQFHARSTQQTDVPGELEISQSTTADKNSVEQGQEVKSKVQ